MPLADTRVGNSPLSHATLCRHRPPVVFSLLFLSPISFISDMSQPSFSQNLFDTALQDRSLEELKRCSMNLRIADGGFKPFFQGDTDAE